MSTSSIPKVGQPALQNANGSAPKKGSLAGRAVIQESPTAVALTVLPPQMPNLRLEGHRFSDGPCGDACSLEERYMN